MDQFECNFGLSCLWSRRMWCSLQVSMFRWFLISCCGWITRHQRFAIVGYAVRFMWTHDGTRQWIITQEPKKNTDRWSMMNFNGRLFVEKHLVDSLGVPCPVSCCYSHDPFGGGHMQLCWRSCFQSARHAQQREITCCGGSRNPRCQKSFRTMNYYNLH